jgi:hypothetical protein
LDNNYYWEFSVTIIATPATVSTNSANNVTEASARLNGSLTNLGTVSSATVSFEYGLTNQFGNTIAAIPSDMSSTGSFYADIPYPSLQCNKLYYFRAKAVDDLNGGNIGYGTTNTFNTVVQGDANGDGVVSMGDVVKVEREILGLDPLTPGADANLDETVNMADVVKIERIILGIDPPVGPSPQKGVVIKVDAPSHVSTNCDFVVGIDINHIRDFDADNFNISFDPAVLRLDNVSNGSIGGRNIPISGYNQRSPGVYTVVQNVAGVPGVNGNGTLAILHFHVIGKSGDSSNITLSSGTLSDNLSQIVTAIWKGDSVFIRSH